MEIMFVCKICKSKNIEELAWIDPNTHKYSSESLGETQDRWCKDCEEHVEFVEE